MPAPSPESHLPLRPVDLHLLLALAEEDLHGYGLVKAIEAGTDGLIRLDPGNLYRVIRRLLQEGLIAESDRRGKTEEGEERRRYYRLTALGRRVLGLELNRLETVIRPPAVRALMRGWAT